MSAATLNATIQRETAHAALRRQLAREVKARAIANAVRAVGGTAAHVLSALMTGPEARRARLAMAAAAGVRVPSDETLRLVVELLERSAS